MTCLLKSGSMYVTKLEVATRLESLAERCLVCEHKPKHLANIEFSAKENEHEKGPDREEYKN